MQNIMGNGWAKIFNSVRSKMVALVILASTLPLLITVAGVGIGTNQLTNIIDAYLKDGILDRIQTLNKLTYDICRQTDELLIARVTAGLNTTSSVIQHRGGIGFAGDTVTWTAVNQFTNGTKEVRLPKMLVGGRWLGQVRSLEEPVLVVDEVKAIAGGVCTLFQRINAQGDMLRVATNVKNKEGFRAIGTYIPAENDGAKNPVVEAVLNGKTYKGQAFVVNAMYSTAYAPIRGPGGQVLGMLFYGLPQDETSILRKSILEKTIGKGGYIAVLGGKGNQRGRYIISKDGKRDGEDISGAKDATGRLVIQEMVDMALKQSEGNVDFYYYGWKNATDPAPRDKIAAITYYKPWDWVILSTAYMDELNDTAKIIHGKTRKFLSWSTLFGLASLCGVLLLVLVFVQNMTKPMKSLAQMSERIALGDVEQEVNFKSKDEIGRLAESFRTMITYMRDLARSAKAIGEGDTSVSIVPKSEKDQLSKNMAFALSQITALMGELNAVNEAVFVGNLSKRGDVSKFAGGYKDIVSGINMNLDAVIKPVMDATRVLEQISKRDLTVRMEGAFYGDHGKIKDAINHAAETLDQSLQQVAIGADQIASASGQIGTGAQSLAQGTSQQASSLEKVSSSIQEMNAMTRQNAANAKEARGIAEATKTSAENGVASMQRLSAAMDLIKKSSDDTAKIIKTIDEIAFQTNLLALNAAVEAARAGEAGKGFAVVAEEVRNLAMRSAEAAKNTADMIEGSVKNAENGVNINQEVMKNLEEINGHAKRVSEVMSEIAAASDQQSQGVGQVNAAMEKMNTLTQQNAANSEESASASEELSAQSQEMRAMVAGFKISGSHSAPSSQTSKAASSSSLKPVLTKVVSKKSGKAEEAFPLDSGSSGKDAFKDF